MSEVLVKIMQRLDVSDVFWSNEAVLFSFKNGMGTLTHKISQSTSKNDYYSKLLLKEKPILQACYPECPTCEGMLATGYGIEKIDSLELKLARECMNSDYLDIVDSAEKIRPLLGLLDDGLYVLADMECFPTDDKGNFFYYVPNKFTHNAATADYYYNFEFFDVVGGFPLYLYPTQSADLINERRVDEYVEILKESSNPPRALTYYEGGFICALLDGHHKACAASILGKKVRSLIILRPDSYSVKDGEKLSGLDTLIGSISFAGIDIPAPSGAKFSDYFSQRKIYARPNEALDRYKLTGRSFPSRYSSFNYPTIKETTGFILMDIDVKDVNYLNSLEYINNPDEESERKLTSVMSYLEGVEG